MSEKDDFNDGATFETEQAVAEPHDPPAAEAAAKIEEPGRTFRDVIAAVDSAASLPESTRRELRSAVHRVAEIISLKAETATIDLGEINRRLNETSPAMAGLTDQSFSNLRSRFRRALKIAGMPVHPGKQTNQLTPAWEAVRKLINDGRPWRTLSRLAHFASQQAWTPAEITDGHIDRLIHVLEHQALHSNPRAFHYALCKTWNKCVLNIAGFPGKALTVAVRRVPYMLDPNVLPEPLRAELDRCFELLENPPILSIAQAAQDAQRSSRRPSPFRAHALRKLAPSTIKHRRFQFLQYLSALVQKGAMQPGEMTSLATVTTLPLIEQGLLFFYERAGNRMAPQVEAIALAVRSIVKHGLKDHARVADIDLMIRQTAGRRRMSQKVERLLRQFDDPANRDKLLVLPEKLMREARALLATDPAEAARLSEIVLAIDMLTLCPIRIGNAVGLDIERHFVRSRPGPKGMLHLVIPAEEVKNRMPIEFEVPPELERTLIEHIERFRPHLPGAASRWLFPRPDGTHEIYRNLGARICKTVFDRAGIRMTSHMFRHFGAEMLLEQMPAGHGIVTGTLGHASSDTAPRYYVRRNMPKAARSFALTILKLRDEARGALRSRRRRR